METQINLETPSTHVEIATPDGRVRKVTPLCKQLLLEARVPFTLLEPLESAETNSDSEELSTENSTD
jgi:hypothetical protein